MNIKFIICIIIGIILYILINKIEGLTCRGPLDDALGNSDRTARIDKLNRGSLPFFPKDNVMVYSEVDPVGYIKEDSKNNSYNNNASLTLICSQGLEDERQDKLAPYVSRNPDYSASLTCHNPSKKVIFWQTHGVIKTQDGFRGVTIQGSINSNVTIIPKKMQLIFYINNGNCYRTGELQSKQSIINNIFSGIYNGDDIVEQDLLYTPIEGNDNSLLNKGFSELEYINGIYMFGLDSQNIFSDLTVLPIYDVYITYKPSQDNIYYTACDPLLYYNQLQNIPFIYNNMLNAINDTEFSILNIIGPYSGWFPIIDFSSNAILDTIKDKYIFSVGNYVRVERRNNAGANTIDSTYTYDMGNMETLKQLIKELMISQSVNVLASYLSPVFQRSDSYRRLFNGEEEIELPIFCPSILLHPYFVNPFNHQIYGEYALQGGQYTAQDLIDLILDIIGQITSVDYSMVKDVYYRKMISLGMSKDEIDTFLSQCNFFYTLHTVTYSIPVNFPLLPFMNLWEPWGYSTINQNYTNLEWSAQTFYLLIQLFKQEEGEAIDVHSFSCLEGIGDERTTNNANMDYSWQYAYSDEEANNPENPEKRIGPECQRPVCPQSETQINDKLEALGLSDFIVDSESYSSEQNRYPKLSEIRYTKSDNDKNITINRSDTNPTGITVRCINKPNVIRQIYCKYDEDKVDEPLNYDESIVEELDPTICNIQASGQTLSPVTVVESVCGVALKLNHF